MDRVWDRGEVLGVNAKSSCSTIFGELFRACCSAAGVVYKALLVSLQCCSDTLVDLSYSLSLKAVLILSESFQKTSFEKQFHFPEAAEVI